MTSAFAADIERLLGDPHDSRRAFSFAALAGLDERGAFPAEICGELNDLGAQAYYVPARFGGAARGFEETAHLIRMIARRDQGVAISHAKTFLGSVCAWLAASQDQASRLAKDVLFGSVVSWGLTEREHGSDLLAGETTALPSDGGLRIDGTKWLINNAGRCDLICLLAKTNPAGGPRGYSLVLVDLRTLPRDTYQRLPQLRTHGMRNADISGISFTGAHVPADSIIGPPGHGLEIVLKGLQLTKTVCAVALSLGALDRALRMTVKVMRTEHRNGSKLADLPRVRRVLVNAYADLLAMEAVTLLATRSINTMTGELSLVSSVVKYLVPATVDQTLASLGALLGVHGVVVSGTETGLFQKIERDHRIVGVFDGNTLVNLNAVINQFPVLVRGHRLGKVDAGGLRAAASIGTPLPEFEPSRLSLVARDGCSVVQSLPDSLLRLCAVDVPDRLTEQARELRGLADRSHAWMAGYRPSAREVPTEAFEQAENYARLFAAASCLRVWLDGSPSDSGLWDNALWPEACLDRLLGQLRPDGATSGSDAVDRLAVPLFEQCAGGFLLSLLDVPTAEVNR